MAEKVMNFGEAMDRNNDMRASYLNHVQVLGKLRDGYCQRSDFYGVTFLPGGRATYTGPGE